MGYDEDYFNSDEFKEILEEYEQSVESGIPVYMDVDDLSDVADYYQMKERYDDAVAAVDRALELSPGATLPLVFKIREAIGEGNIEAAEDYFSRIDDPTDVEAQYVQAEILIAQDKCDEAEELFRKQLQMIDPDEYQDFVVDVASIFTDYGVYDKAMEWIMRGRQENSDDFKELMGRTLFGLGRYKDSERIFNELIDRNPFQKRYWNALASSQFMREDYGASVTSSEYAIAIDPDDPDGLLAKANGLSHLNNFEESLSYYERYTEHVPNDEFALLNQGACLINLERFNEAADRLEQALHVAPDDSPYLADIYQELGFVYSELHKPDTALYYLDQTDKLEGVDQVDMMVVKGHVLMANNRVDEAEKLFSRAVKESGNSPRVMLRVIVSLYDNRYTEAAFNMFHRYFDFVDNDWNEGYSYMALCCWELREYTEFLKYLKEAVERNPKEARLVLDHLFPEGMEPKDYVGFIMEKLKN